jgi:hypothetical protein
MTQSSPKIRFPYQAVSAEQLPCGCPWWGRPVIAKIARAHLNEFPDYYTRLATMEAQAQADQSE